MDIDEKTGMPILDWYVALGSNLGDSWATLRSARTEIAKLGVLQAASPIYSSPPMYELDQPPFLNAVVWLRSTLAGEALLEQLRQIEQRFGRIREEARRYGPRSLDLDLVAGVFGDEALIYQTPALTVPHERLAERAFVLKPLLDVAPTWKHPHRGESGKVLLERLGDDANLQVAYQPEEWA